MAHFAQIKNGKVEQVIVISNDVIENKPFPESEPIGIAFCKSLYGQETEWLQTSYNSNFRKHYAGIGSTYDYVNDVFISPKPYESWILNDSFEWEAPVKKPDEGLYYWNEDLQKWMP